MFRVRTQFTGVTGAPYLSTMYFLPTAGLTAQNAVASVGNFWQAMGPYIANAALWATEVEVASVDATTGAVTGITSTTPRTGTPTGGGTALPWATQGLVRWRTGTFAGGREIRGRTFIPAISVSASTASVPAAAFQTAANTACAALISDPLSDFCVWSKKNGTDPLAASGSLWNEFAVLRSRRD